MSRNIVGGIAVLALGFICCKPLLLRDLPPSSAAPLLLVIADPQVHNVTGGLLRQEGILPDMFAGVARRRPELNLLAPYLFEDALRHGLAAGPALTLVLGDVSDIACVQEHETISQIVSANANGGLVLFAHGNHDSYLMGTVNSYGPPAALAQNPPHGDRPEAASWWKYDPGVAAGYSDKAWPSACLGPDGKLDDQHFPMNKATWLARAIDWLARYDVAVTSAPISDDTEPRYSLRGDNGRVFVDGEWLPTDPEAWAASYRSYLVQLVELPTFRVLVIDTSVCREARGGFAYASTNAGSHGCIGRAQFASMRRLLAANPANAKKPVVFAGHFNLAQLIPSDRKVLIDLIQQWGDTYLSAHTHDEANQRDWGPIAEFNIGSTTDWPMEAALLSIKDGRAVPATLISPVAKMTRYHRAWAWESDEYCRHAAAAIQLAAVGKLGSPYPQQWESPSTCGCVPASRQALGEALREIERRVGEDAAYREYVLSVAKGASYADRDELGRRIP